MAATQQDLSPKTGNPLINLGNGQVDLSKLQLNLDVAVKKAESAEKAEQTVQKTPEKPKAERKSKITRIPTGISGLDQEIRGGFVKNSTNLVSGIPGSGKSIFAMQFLYYGAVNGEPGIYISFEEEKEDVYKYMEEFGWDLAKLEKEGKFVFLRYSPEQVNKLLEEGGGAIDTFVQKIKAKRVVIDSITAFMLLHKDELARREAALLLFDIISKWGCTTLMTAESGAGSEQKEYSVAEFEVDGVILLYNLKKKNMRQRVAEILKMRGTRFDPKIIPMRIAENGIELFPEEIVF